MKVTLTRQLFGQLEIDEANFLNEFGPQLVSRAGLSDLEIRNAIVNPIGSWPLSKIAKDCESVLIVTDDNTRATPVKRILPIVLDELYLGGIKKHRITILVGLGTHRPMTKQEMVDKFGEGICQQYCIVNHEWNNPESLISYGTCAGGFEIVINKLVNENDLILTIGSIVPHATTGFSGGGKTIMPGICGEKTIEDTHWMALKYSMTEILGNPDNPVQKTINSISKKINLRMIINTILFNGCEVFGIVAGDPESAFKRGIDICKKLYGVHIKEKADIVIAEAYPTDIDLRQAIKAICSADIVCKDGGVIILPAECKEGIAPQFPEFEKYGFRDPETVYNQVNDGKFKQKLMAYTLVAIGRIISTRVNAILVSPNIYHEQARRIGFQWAANLDEAIKLAFQFVDKDSKIIVLKKAGELLPIVSIK